MLSNTHGCVFALIVETESQLLGFTPIFESRSQEGVSEMQLPVQLVQQPPICATTLRETSVHSQLGRKQLLQVLQEIAIFGLRGGKELNAAVGDLLD